MSAAISIEVSGIGGGRTFARVGVFLKRSYKIHFCIHWLLVFFLIVTGAFNVARAGSFVDQLARSPWPQILRDRVLSLVISGSWSQLRTTLEVLADPKYVKQQGVDLSEPMRMGLAEFRVECQTLRAFFIVLSATHEVPADFDFFIKKLGKLKDSLHLAKQGGYSRKMLRLQNHHARDLLALLKSRPYFLADILDAFAPAGAHNLVEFIRHDLHSAVANWDLSRSAGFSGYHEYRKLLRNYAQLLKVIFQYESVYNAVAPAEAEKAELIALARDIHTEQSQMGKVLDQFQRKAMIRGKSPQSIKKKFSLPESLMNTMHRLVHHFFPDKHAPTCRGLF